MKLVIKKSSIDDGLVRPLYLIYYHFNAIIVPNSLYNSTILKKIDTWSRIKEFNVEINIGTFWDGGLGFGTWEIYLLPSVAALLEIGVGSGLKWTCLGRVLHAGWRPPSFNLLLFCVRVPSADRTLRPLPRRHARELDCPPPTVALPWARGRQPAPIRCSTARSLLDKMLQRLRCCRVRSSTTRSQEE